MIEALRSTKLTRGTVRTTGAGSTCLNCGAPLVGPFCSQCGQRDIPPYPSVRELVVDAFWELSGWDGRFASTVRELVRRPGMLTREFLEGRRARYLSPLRLYLLASLSYFVIAASAPDVRTASGKSPLFIGLKPSPSGTRASAPERVATAAERAMRTREENSDPDLRPEGKPLTAEERAAVLKDIERAPAVARPFLRRAVTDPAGFRREVSEISSRWRNAASFDSFSLAQLILESVSVGGHFRMYFPVEMVLMVKALITFEGVGQVLMPGIDVAHVSRAHIRRIFLEQFNPVRIMREELRGAPDLVDALAKLPLLITEGVRVLERSTRAPAESPLSGIRGAMLAGFCLVAAALLIALHGPWPAWALLLVLAVALAARRERG